MGNQELIAKQTFSKMWRLCSRSNNVLPISEKRLLLPELILVLLTN
jgi:hypothetical protein